MKINIKIKIIAVLFYMKQDKQKYYLFLFDSYG